MKPAKVVERLGFAMDVMGWRPVSLCLRQTALSFFGDGVTPPNTFDLTSLKILQPRLAWEMWRGRVPTDRRVPIYNLYNHTPTPEAEGWSVKKRQVRDFRGGRLSYNSHNATDFATPPGTVVVAPARGRVVLVVREYNRGGLKLMLDHGGGLTTSMAHLARVTVRVGEVVERGAPVALSGASGLNFVAALGADPPHLHFNVWVDGWPVDPFRKEGAWAEPGEASIWRGEDNRPVPHEGGRWEGEAESLESDWDEEGVMAYLASCRHPEMKAQLEALPTLEDKAQQLIFFGNYYPTRFGERPRLYRQGWARRPYLDLPFQAALYRGVRFLEDGSGA